MTMFTRHVSRQLAAYINGELSPSRAQQAELHMGQCPLCRAECEQVRLGMSIVEHLPLVEAPQAIWTAIETAFQENRSRRIATLRRWRPAFAVAVVLTLAGAAYWPVAHQSAIHWQVVRLDGSPAVGAKHIRGAGQIGAGEWIETDSGSRATVKVGEIGSVEVAPNTRVRVVTALPGEHRLALARGEIRATISAPPKLFFVETASGTAVDLGCEYVLNTDEDGSGLLRVTRGWVSFQWKNLDSLVPAGASCRTRPHVGPGIPYFDDAPESVKQALEMFGFEKAGDNALAVILSESRVRDTLTLWHLLSRVEAADRERVYDRIAALTPVPAAVSRRQALKLEPETLKRWKEELAWTW
jgi:anti-sigma factor RsiW